MADKKESNKDDSDKKERQLFFGGKWNPPYTFKEKMNFLKVLESCDFNIGRACLKFNNMRRNNFSAWRKADPDFEEAYQELRNREVDIAEEQHRVLRFGLPKLNKDGDIVGWKIPPDRRAIEFFLKTQAPDRGYVDRQEITGKDGASLYPDMTDNEQNELIDELLRKRSITSGTS